MAVGDKLEAVEIDGNVFQAVEVESSGNSCNGCAAKGGQHDLCSNLPHCSHNTRDDEKEVIWIKLVKEEAPEPKGVTILEVRAALLELESKISTLIDEFEVKTDTLVTGVNLTNWDSVAIDVRLN